MLVGSGAEIDLIFSGIDIIVIGDPVKFQLSFKNDGQIIGKVGVEEFSPHVMNV